MPAYSAASGLISGVLGAIAGGSQAAGDEAKEQQQAQMLALRDQRLAQIAVTTHAANVQTDTQAAIAEEQRKQGQVSSFYQKTALPTTPSAPVSGQDAGESGGTLTEGSTTQMAPDRGAQAASRLEAAKQSGNLAIIGQAYTEDKDVRADKDQDRKQKLEEARVAMEGGKNVYYGAAAKEMESRAARDQAIADATDRDAKVKPILPEIIEEKNVQGKVIGAFDKRSGARMTVIPAIAETPSKWHPIDANEPAKPAQAEQAIWKDSSGKVLSGGIADLYPSLSQRAPGAAAPGTAPGMAPQPKTAPKAPAAYPNAKLAPDGQWYIQRPDGFYKVS